VVKPERTTVRLSIKRPGYNIEAYQSTRVYAKISGYIGKWHVDIGDLVRRGALLAELYVPEMEVDVQQKEAAAKQADTEIRLAQANVDRAQAELAFKKSQFERFSRLGQSVLDKENIAEARYTFDAGQAALAKAQAEVAVAEARLEVARKTRDYAKEILLYAKITAPFDGVITERNVNDGDFVQPVSGKKGEPLFVIEQVDPVRVFVHVPEREAVWIQGGDAALVRSASRPDQEYRGKVTRTSRALNPTTRTLKTEIDLPNLKRELLPGMYVDITVFAERRDVWALPASAVVVEDEKRYCYRLEAGKAVRTPLKLGLRGDKLVEVLQQQTRSPGTDTEGTWQDITGAEEIIRSGAAGLKDGQTVQVSVDGK
jgi:RND family efflux transporter MFP subunit